MNRIRMACFFLFLMALFFGGCQKTSHGKSLELSWGKPRTVHIFADPGLWRDISDDIARSLEHGIRTTEEEIFFQIERIPINALEKNYKFNNILFIGCINEHGPVHDYLKSHLDPASLGDFGRGSVRLMMNDDLWAVNQRVVYLIAWDTEALLEFLPGLDDDLFEPFREGLLNHIRTRIYGTGVLPVSRFARYPFHMRVPAQYNLTFRDDPEERTLILLARKVQNPRPPDRFLAVTWEDETGGTRNWEDWIPRMRKQLWPDEDFEIDPLRTVPCEIGGLAGVRVSGIWWNTKSSDEPDGGGPFTSWALYDASDNRTFLIDNVVFYPEGTKLEALLELEVITKTFLAK